MKRETSIHSNKYDFDETTGSEEDMEKHNAGEMPEAQGGKLDVKGLVVKGKKRLPWGIPTRVEQRREGRKHYSMK